MDDDAGENLRGPVDPDAGGSREWSAHRYTLPVIAVGGALGAAARHGLEVAWPASGGAFPWATFATNVSGCLLLGALMVLVVERERGHPLLRPFAGVGVLGGFTTFSTYAVQTTGLVDAEAPAVALLYLFATLAAALAAVALGVVTTRALTHGRGRVGLR